MHINFQVKYILVATIEEIMKQRVTDDLIIKYTKDTMESKFNCINPLKTRQNLAEISRNELCQPLHNQKKNTNVFSFVDYNCL